MATPHGNPPSIGEVVPLWYQWVDGATFEVEVKR